MIESELVKFYNDIKANSWPNIETSSDLYHLSDSVLDELNKNFALSKVMHDLTNIKTLKDRVYPNLLISYKKDQVIFVTVEKCASSFFQTLFGEVHSGWEKVNMHDFDPTEFYFISVIQHPLRRRLKGLTQVLYETYKNAALDMLNDARFKRLIETISVGEIHSMPYSILFNNYTNYVDFVPMCIGELQTNYEVEKRLMQHGITDKISGYPKVHESDSEKLKIYEELKRIFFQSQTREFLFPYLEDLQFYQELVKKYKLR